MASAKSRSSAPVLPLASLSLHRSHSPTRHFYSSSYSFNLSPRRCRSSPVKFDLAPKRNLHAHSPVSPKAVQKAGVPSGSVRKMCLCSPSNHPGAFRCNLHRNCPRFSAPSNSQLQIRRSAMKNSLVRIGGVEGEWMKKALSSLIRPSSHQLRRRTSFCPKPSRLRQVTRAEDLAFT